jgi:hypothetical protein
MVPKNLDHPTHVQEVQSFPFISFRLVRNEMRAALPMVMM